MSNNASSLYLLDMHPSAFVSICQQSSAVVSIRQHTSEKRQHVQQRIVAVLVLPRASVPDMRMHSCCVAYASIRPHTSAYVRIRPHTSAVPGLESRRVVARHAHAELLGIRRIRLELPRDFRGQRALGRTEAEAVSQHNRQLVSHRTLRPRSRRVSTYTFVPVKLSIFVLLYA